jgi:predicted alpha/beta-hydrolase family hydrolase
MHAPSADSTRTRTFPPSVGLSALPRGPARGRDRAWVWRTALMLGLALGATAVAAQGRVLQVPTRPGVSTSVYWHPVAQAQATVLFFPGAGGGFGRLHDGQPGSLNFLVRSAPYFRAAGYNVAIFGLPSDTKTLDNAHRVGADHLRDMQAVLAALRQRAVVPVWVLGTSRGTVSATALAAHVGEGAIAGLVLASSIGSARKPGAIDQQNLAAIRVPVLLLHHRRDACSVSRPQDVPTILQGLVHAPLAKLRWVDGGADPTGRACGAHHWHGFVGMDQEAVADITDWMARPAP